MISARPIGVVPALRGARTLVEARAIARQVLAPGPAAISPEGRPTLDRFADFYDRAAARALDAAEIDAENPTFPTIIPARALSRPS